MYAVGTSDVRTYPAEANFRRHHGKPVVFGRVQYVHQFADRQHVRYGDNRVVHKVLCGDVASQRRRFAHQQRDTGQLDLRFVYAL